jgi:dephospho-CoA kinase
MQVIGICGGVACGKSAVARQFEELGAITLHADRIGHEVLLDSTIKRLIRARWGEVVFAGNGEVDRKALANRVFALTEQGRKGLSDLEQITHPEIGRRLRAQLENWKREKTVQVVVLDAPVMFKAGWDTMCQHLVFVDTPLERRELWAAERGWSPGELARREMSQTSLQTKRDRADFIVDNSGTLEQTMAQVRQIWQQILPTP